MRPAGSRAAHGVGPENLARHGPIEAGSIALDSSLEDIDIYPFDPFQTSGRSPVDGVVLGFLPWTPRRTASNRNRMCGCAWPRKALSANRIKASCERQPRVTRSTGLAGQNTRVLSDAQLRDEPNAVFLFAYRHDPAGFEAHHSPMPHDAHFLALDGQPSGGDRS